MSVAWGFAIPLVALYGLFLLWYGGRGRPLAPQEAEQLLARLSSHIRTAEDEAMLDNLRALAAQDDGREFVMQNLVRYRPRAIYPAGYSFNDDPRAADRRYGRAVIWPLLRHGSVMLFVASRRGHFVRPPDGEDWTYVAMVRYRSLRDFLRFTVDIEQQDIVVHKWAAIEKTQIFPVKPMLSLFFVRGAVALVIGLTGIVLVGLAG